MATLKAYLRILFSRSVWLSQFVLTLVAVHLMFVVTDKGDQATRLWMLGKGFVWIVVATSLFVLLGTWACSMLGPKKKPLPALEDCAHPEYH